MNLSVIVQHHKDFFELILDWFLLSARINRFNFRSLRYGMESQRLFRESFSPVLEFNGFNSLISLLWLSKDSFEFILESVLAQCWNLTGSI